MERINKSNNNSIFFEFQNISYSLVSPKNTNSSHPEESLKSLKNQNEKRNFILNSITGFALPNQVLAIIGPTGSGKSTLLSILADRHSCTDSKVFKIDRNVKGNNVCIDYNNFGKICGYVEQNNIHFEYLTVKELLYFGSQLKLKLRENLLREKVNLLLKKFGLELCADSYISSLSGGEKKRVSIAYELITEPQIILLDEPTSGLDFYSSAIIMKYLKKLAIESNKTIICSLHQASSEFENFIDRIILLKEGEIVYQGETFHAVNNYFPNNFEKYNFYQNPFDYFLEILDKYSTEILIEKYKNYISPLISSYLTLYNKEYHTQSIRIFEIEESRTVSIWVEINSLFKRYLINYIRNKNVFLSRFVQFLSHSILIVMFYMNLNNKNQQSPLTNFVGFCFNCVNSIFSFGMYSTIPSIYQYKNVFTKEYPSKLYRFSSFFISTVLFLLIQSLFFSTIFTFLVTFTIMNFNCLQFYLFFVCNLVDYFIGASYGLLLGISLDESKIYSVAPFVFILSMLGSGILRNNLSFPFLLKIINYWSHYRYLLEIHFESEGDKINSTLNYEFGYTNCMIILVVLLVILNILSFFSLKRYAKRLKL